MNIFRSVKKHIAVPKFIRITGDLRDLEDWRIYYVDLMFILSIILVPAGLLVGLPVLIATGNYVVIFMDSVIIIITAVFFIKPEIFPKKVMLFVLVYTLLVMHLVYFGPASFGPGWLIFSAVTASLIFRTPAAFITVGFNAIMLSIMCFSEFLKLDSWTSTYSEPVMGRIMFIVNMSFLSLASSLPVSILLNRLDNSFHREKGLSEKLMKESEELHRINFSLEHEITERRRSEGEREKLQDQLLQVQKMESIGRLAGGIAHDYNNMLSVILGNTEMLLADSSISEANQSVIADIHTAGLRSADLTRQLLGFARKQAAKPVPLDLNVTINGMMKMLKRLISENIVIEWRPGNSVWKVRIDPSQVDQVLVNLFVNARDAISDEGKIKIETSTTEVDESYTSAIPGAVPGDYTMLTVSDTGSGMDRETLANIFEPFFTTKGEGLGTGLGLATVYGIVHQNSGFIHAYSEPGVGTTFRIYLPRYGDENTEKIRRSEKREIIRGKETILIVEDEKSVLNLAVNLLTKLGYNVLSAKNPGEGIAIAAGYSGKIHLLLSDVVLPGINGRALHEKIAGIKPDIKCLYMSGYTDDIIAHHGILFEGVYLIQKPFSLETLASRIRSVIDID
ncbi:MAG TPA: ATP-binding protein [Spirochaetota bacterium]|nr:ATP-binding protein [Spirochaetota bacterium]